MSEDAAILRRYVATRSHAAFAELVQRHLNLVYAVALRQVGGDVHLANDVAQQVFVSLARKAATLTDRPTLTGWLYRSTHFAASDVVRMERRRREREQKAHAMNPHENTALPFMPPGDAVDWEPLRPTIDAAIADLDERDRDAVLLRFFESCTYAEVGSRLKLSENASRMRVERALDKLHAALSRRGITSTSAALGVALAHQALATVPAGLATAITGVAVASSTVGAIGLLSLFTTGKAAASLGIGATTVALGVVGWQQVEKAAAEREVAIAQQEVHAVRRDISSLQTRLDQAERRAQEAERDRDALLKAVEGTRSEPTLTADRAAGVRAAAAASRDPAADERLAQERAYQQQLAKRRAEEAKARAKIESEAAAEPDADARYHKFIEAAENYASNADFQAAIRAYNQAMTMKPSTTPISDRVRQLQMSLRDQYKPVEISLISDGLTAVSVTGPYGQRPPSPLQSATLKVLPANYEVIGRRQGFQDVVIPLEVRAGKPAPVISVTCTVPSQN